MNEKAANGSCWYFISSLYCPLCARTVETRERRYDERPEDHSQRHEVIEHWCGCGA